MNKRLMDAAIELSSMCAECKSPPPLEQAMGFADEIAKSRGLPQADLQSLQGLATKLARSFWKAAAELAEWCAELLRPATIEEAQRLACEVADAHGLEPADRGLLLTASATFAAATAELGAWDSIEVVKVCKHMLRAANVIPPSDEAAWLDSVTGPTPEDVAWLKGAEELDLGFPTVGARNRDRLNQAIGHWMEWTLSAHEARSAFRRTGPLIDAIRVWASRYATQPAMSDHEIRLLAATVLHETHLDASEREVFVGVIEGFIEDRERRRQN